ncbi:GDP-mannose 4,6-dehydratase [bacterium]|jgi:GDPmannose 4,6-dehydratase|nr:GDP-mannose 4,6-dehydratase [bacterium]
MNRKICLITGVNGQDGSFLAEFLLNKGYDVHGIIRRSSSFNTQRIDHIFNNPNLTLHFGDMTDALAIDDLIKNLQPDEIYHLAAQSHVKVSFELPRYTAEVDAIGTLNLLESIRKHSPKTRLYNACTSELFGKAQEIPQKETTRFYPRSPYGVAKLYSYWILVNYVESYNIFAVNGILFNHESERRGETFVTRKITIGLSRLSNNYQIVNDKKQVMPPISLGNIYTKRDWGYAPDYVEAMWLMLQHNKPETFVIATGETHTIKEFIDEAIKHTPFDGKVKWIGNGIDEQLIYDDKIILIKIDSKYYRPAEVEHLVGDAYKAKTELGWTPSTKFHELVRKMMVWDMEHYIK